jgi:hypothetical protein
MPCCVPGGENDGTSMSDIARARDVWHRFSGHMQALPQLLRLHRHPEVVGRIDATGSQSTRKSRWRCRSPAIVACLVPAFPRDEKRDDDGPSQRQPAGREP